MGQYTSYYLYQKYEKRGEQDWIPCYPNTYSISGDVTNPMSLVVKSENDTQCGYTPTPTGTPIYSWNTVEGYVCDECTPTKAMIHDESGNTYIISGSGEITQSDVSAYRNDATDIVITNNATAIGNNAFSGFTSVGFVRIPNNVLTIGDNAFNSCSVMTECQIPYGTATIGANAFGGCTSLMYVDIPSTVTSIGDGAFGSCLNFRYTSIPSSVTSIPNNCFYNCDGLSDIELPSSITSIGDDAFAECSGLYSVTVYNTTPPTLGSNVFQNTNSDLKIYVPSSSVDTYKAASGWSSYASKINAIQ